MADISKVKLPDSEVYNIKDANALPKAGGTMTGDITFAGISPSSYPAASKGIKWSGGTDAIDMYYNLRASDAGELIINMRDDANVRTSFAYNGTVKSYIDTNGVYNGNASTADKWKTARTLTIGSTGKSVDGSGNVSWSLSEIGAAPSVSGGYLPLSGGTMTGVLTMKGEQYNGNYALNMNNSDIVNANRIIFADRSDSANEGLSFWRSASTYDAFWISDGVMYFTPNSPTDTTNNVVIHSGNYTTYTVKKDGTGASGTWGINITGNAATATTATTATKLGSSTIGSVRRPIYLNTGTATEANYMVSHFGNAGKSNMNDIGRLHASSGMTNLSDPSNTTDNPLNGTTKSTGWHLYWSTNYTDDPSGSNSWVAQIANKAGTAQWWVRSRSGSTITNGTEWAAGWEHLVVAPQTGQGGTTTPIYVDTNGHVQSIGYTIAKSVPSNAVFTDTNYYHTTGSWNGLTYTATKVGSPGDLAFTIPTGTTATTVAVGNHAHGLLHSALNQAATNGTTGGWSMIGIDPTVNGYVLKSIRVNTTSPNWLSGDYGAGIAFGGSDTKGVISLKYNTPTITFAGGNHNSSKTEPVWYIKITGTSGSTYNLANFLTSHQSVSDKNVTLAWGTQKIIATIGSTDIHVTLPTNPNTNTTYTIATGDSNGQIKVTPSSDSAYNVNVKGLGSAAYTDSSAYVRNYTGASRSTTTTGSWVSMVNSSQAGAPVLPVANKWWQVLSLDCWSSAPNNWVSQLAFPTQDSSSMYYRRNTATGISIDSAPWIKIMDIENMEEAGMRSSSISQSFTLDSSMSSITRTQNLHNRANRLALIPGANISVEYTTDGSTWTSMGLTTNQCANLFNDCISADIPIGPNDSSERTTSMQTRITITSDGRDQTIDQFILWLNSAYQTISIDIQVAYGNATTTFSNWKTGTSLSSWRYQCMINTTSKRIGTTTTSAYVNKIRFIFKYTSIDSSHKTAKASIYSIAGYSGIYWGGASKNNLMYLDHLYTWDNSQNATFPAQINGTGATFTSSSFGPLAIIRSGSTNAAGIKFYNNTSTYLGALGINTANSRFLRWNTDNSTSYEIIDRSVVSATPSAVVNTNWSTGSDRTTVVTKGWMSYWNGAYDGSSSNLAYCNKGAFGTIVTKNTGDYLPITGGTLTGLLTLYREGTTANNYPAGITFSLKDTTTGKTYSSAYIYAYQDHQSTPYGVNLVVNPGGGLFIGSGESPSSHYSAKGSTYNGEDTYITADGTVFIQANGNTIANRLGFYISTSQQIIPCKAETATNNVGSIGTSSYKWASMYATTFYGDLSGNATTATSAVNANNATNATYADQINTTVTDGTTSQTAYGILFAQDPSASEYNGARKTNNFRINLKAAAAGSEGLTELVLGNNKAVSAANNESGIISLYSAGGSYHQIKTTSVTSAAVHMLPTKGGTILNTGELGVSGNLGIKNVTVTLNNLGFTRSSAGLYYSGNWSCASDFSKILSVSIYDFSSIKNISVQIHIHDDTNLWVLIADPSTTSNPATFTGTLYCRVLGILK